ncbi:unnamed protein product [Rhodiola kirilowii]
MTNRWIRPEVYPLFAATGVAVGICAMQLIRNISTNPDVRVTKENRTAGCAGQSCGGREVLAALCEEICSRQSS